MFLAISEILSGAEVSAMRDAAALLEFVDGRATAGRHAARVKANEQAGGSPELEAILAKASASLLANPLFVSAVRPRHMIRLLLSRYRPGMAYGSHVDDAIMAGHRTDISFTLFLTPPGACDGGGLVLEDTLEERTIKLDAGEVFVYPSNTVHRVEPVTSGERLAIVGWAQSWVRSPDQRQILFDLDQSVEEAAVLAADSDHFKRLAKTRSNLIRMWAEG
jgi:PKHD-type hydroxylase